MESLLISIGTAVNHLLTTEEGRRMICDIGTRLVVMASTAADVADAPAPVAVATPPPAPASVPTPRQFPSKYTTLQTIVHEVKLLIESIPSSDDLLNKINVISKISWDIIHKHRGILIFSRIKNTLLTRCNENIAYLNAHKHEFAPNTWKWYMDDFTHMKKVIENYLYFNPVTWYEADGTRCTAAYVDKSHSFIEVRRGDLTGKALVAANRRTWASADELNAFWRTNNILVHDIAYQMSYY